MERYLLIVARERPELLPPLGELHGEMVRVFLDRRQVPRPAPPVAAQQPTDFERRGYIIVSVG